MIALLEEHTGRSRHGEEEGDENWNDSVSVYWLGGADILP